MALLDWSMSLLGYPEHQLSGAAVVGVSHMSTHHALRFAEAVGLYTGWLEVDPSLATFEGVGERGPEWVALAELFVANKVAITEGVVGGSAIFASGVPADGRPPADRTLIAWAEEHKRPWVRVVDNEIAYWGGLDANGIEALLCWFLAQRPMQVDWKTTTLSPEAAATLRRGLFDHGWTRNLSQVHTGWRPSVALWAGIHSRCVLEHDGLRALSACNQGLRLGLRGGSWVGEAVPGPCPLDDDTSRITVTRR